MNYEIVLVVGILIMLGIIAIPLSIWLIISIIEDYRRIKNK